MIKAQLGLGDPGILVDERHGGCDKEAQVLSVFLSNISIIFSSSFSGLSNYPRRVTAGISLSLVLCSATRPNYTNVSLLTSSPIFFLFTGYVLNTILGWYQ